MALDDYEMLWGLPSPKGDKLCHDRERSETIVYCKAKYFCKYRSQNQIPYARNGQIAGREYTCLKKE
jgi:hypothetical protein